MAVEHAFGDPLAGLGQAGRLSFWFFPNTSLELE